MEKGLVGILLATLCSNYPQDIFKTSTTTPYPTYRQTTSSPSKEFRCQLKTNEQLRLNLLQGKRLKIATLQYQYPLSDVVINGSDLQLVKDTVAAELVEVLQDMFGFTYQVVVPKKNILGDSEEGIFGMLNNNEADMAAALLPMVPGSNKYVQWGVEMMQNNYYALMKRPRASATGSGIFAPFTTDVWIMILVSVVVVGPIMFLIIYLRARLCDDDSHVTMYPIIACVWFVYGALLKQGSTLSPVTDSSRLLFATWWIFIMILTAFYTANLTAFLTLSRFTLPIETVRDIERSNRRWFAEEGGPVEYAIMNGEDGDLITLKSSVIKEKGHFLNTITEDDVMQYIYKKDWLYLGETNTLKKIILDDYNARAKQGLEERDRCKYVLTQTSLLSRNLAFGFPKSSILPSLFNPVMLSLVEGGIIQHRVQQQLSAAEVCPLDLGSKERQLRNADLLTTYFIIMSGFATALTVFIVENLYRRYLTPKFPHPKSWPLDVSLEPKTLFSRSTEGKSKEHSKVNINGRDYYIVISKNGEKRFIPIRTPSALLFQYAPK